MTLFAQGHHHPKALFSWFVKPCSLIRTLQIIDKDLIFVSLCFSNLFENKVLRNKSVINPSSQSEWKFQYFSETYLSGEPFR